MVVPTKVIDLTPSWSVRRQYRMEHDDPECIHGQRNMNDPAPDAGSAKVSQ
jgi:hypothetical protein